jgi:hypothetical protein
MGSLRARNNLLGVAGWDSVTDYDALEREGYELALRLGNNSFALHFLMLLAQAALRRGEWGAWMNEIAAEEEGGTIHPFYQVTFANVRAVLASLRGDRESTARQLGIARAAAAPLESQQSAASLALTEAVVARSAGDWPTAISRGTVAGQYSDFSLEGADLAAQAAVAGGLAGELSEAIALLRPLQSTGRLAVAALAAAEAGQLTRSGRWEEARAGYRKALSLRHEAGDLLEAAFTGLSWGLLAGAQDPEAKTAQTEAEAFFAWRGGTPTVIAYKAAFVPVSGSAAAVPATAGARTEAPSPASRT